MRVTLWESFGVVIGAFMAILVRGRQPFYNGAENTRGGLARLCGALAAHPTNQCPASFRAADADSVFHVVHAATACDDVLDRILHLPDRHGAVELDDPLVHMHADIAHVHVSAAPEVLADFFPDSLVRTFGISAREFRRRLTTSRVGARDAELVRDLAERTVTWRSGLFR